MHARVRDNYAAGKTVLCNHVDTPIQKNYFALTSHIIPIKVLPTVVLPLSSFVHNKIKFERLQILQILSDA